MIRLTGLSVATLVRLEGDSGGKNRVTLIAVGRALKVEPPELLADWGTGVISEQQFLDAFSGRRKRIGASAEEFLERHGLLDRRRSSMPRVDFMTAEPGKGTPILGAVTAGGMVESIVFDPGEEPERIPLYYPDRARTYALRILGDSMAPEYRPGEILIVQDATVEELEDGEDAVVQCNGGADGCSTFKRCVFVSNLIVRLMPLNDQYKPIDCPVDHIVRIGKVLGVYRPRTFRTHL